jgi:IS30 family transposase
MRKIKEMIRLKEAGLSNRQIAGSCAVSPSSVFEVLRRAEEMDLDWSAAENLDLVRRRLRSDPARSRADPHAK